MALLSQKMVASRGRRVVIGTIVPSRHVQQSRVFAVCHQPVGGVGGSRNGLAGTAGRQPGDSLQWQGQQQAAKSEQAQSGHEAVHVVQYGSAHGSHQGRVSVDACNRFGAGA